MAKSAKTLTEYFEVDKEVFQKLGILDAFLFIDSHFFLDPLLLKSCSILELKKSRKEIETYFEEIIRLLKVTKSKEDLAWKEAKKRLLFKEIRGVAIGHGASTNDGSGIGPKLREKLLERAEELVKLGVEDPAVFEMIGFFDEDFGPDRLSDMTVWIIRHNLFSFTERITKELNLKPTTTFRTPEKNYTLPLHPNRKKAIILLPKELLRDLPIAKSWEDISYIAWFNEALRNRLNELLGKIWKKLNNKQKKESLRRLLLSEKDAMASFLGDYKKYPAKPYDFNNDPKGEILWLERARKVVHEQPISLSLPASPKINDIEQVVDKIVTQFQRLIETNGWNSYLYEQIGFRKKKKHERNSQLLFYGVADTYCEANNIDINREPNAGTGPVDFKFSKSYKLRFLVEIKLSSNSNLVHGYSKQLPTYEQSERTDRSAYVIIKVTNTKQAQNNIDEVLRLEKEAVDNNKTHPKVYIIDGIIRPTASKR